MFRKDWWCHIYFRCWPFETDWKDNTEPLNFRTCIYKIRCLSILSSNTNSVHFKKLNRFKTRQPILTKKVWVFFLFHNGPDRTLSSDITLLFNTSKHWRENGKNSSWPWLYKKQYPIALVFCQLKVQKGEEKAIVIYFFLCSSAAWEGSTAARSKGKRIHLQNKT